MEAAGKEGGEESLGRGRERRGKAWIGHTFLDALFFSHTEISASSPSTARTPSTQHHNRPWSSWVVICSLFIDRSCQDSLSLLILPSHEMLAQTGLEIRPLRAFQGSRLQAPAARSLAPGVESSGGRHHDGGRGGPGKVGRVQEEKTRVLSGVGGWIPDEVGGEAKVRQKKKNRALKKYRGGGCGLRRSVGIRQACVFGQTANVFFLFRAMTCLCV